MVLAWGGVGLSQGESKPVGCGCAAIFLLIALVGFGLFFTLLYFAFREIA